MKRYAISDIHGCVKTFRALLDQIAFSKSDILYLLGDYIDRGPDSKGVINHIWQLQTEDYQIFCLKGNHEQMLLDSAANPRHERHWLMHGGWATLDSFGLNNLSDLPAPYLQWMEKLPHYMEIEGYILVHAGLNLSIENPLADETAMLWARRWYTASRKKWLGNRIVVHGHTPIERSAIERGLQNLDFVPVLDIDGGCVFVEARYRKLCAFDLDEQKLYFHERIEERNHM